MTISTIRRSILKVLSQLSHDSFEERAANDVLFGNRLSEGRARAECVSEELVEGAHAVELQELKGMEEADRQCKITLHCTSLHTTDTESKEDK